MQRSTSEIRRDYPADAGARPGDAKYDSLRESIRKHGIRNPIILDATGRIMDGNHRHAVAVSLGMATVPVRIWTGTDYIE